MKHLLLILTITLLTLQSALALDLTPFETYKELEGMKIPLVQFSDAKGKVNYHPPGNWRLVGGGKSLSFVPPDADQALVKFIAIDKKPEPVPTSENLKAWAQQFIPEGSKDIAFANEIPSPFTLEGQASNEFIFTYVLSGRPETIAIAVCDLSDKERFVAIVSTQTKDFDAIHRQVISSLFSWMPAK